MGVREALSQVLKQRALVVAGCRPPPQALRTSVRVSVPASFTGSKGDSLTVSLNLKGQRLSKSHLQLRSGDTVALLKHGVHHPSGALSASIACRLDAHLQPGALYSLEERLGGDMDAALLLEETKIVVPQRIHVFNSLFDELPAGVSFMVTLQVAHPNSTVVSNSIVIGCAKTLHAAAKLNGTGRSRRFRVELVNKIEPARDGRYDVVLAVRASGARSPQVRVELQLRRERRGEARSERLLLHKAIAQAVLTVVGRKQAGVRLDSTASYVEGHSYASLARNPLVQAVVGDQVKDVRRLIKRLSRDGCGLADVCIRAAKSNLTHRHYTAEWYTIGETKLELESAAHAAVLTCPVDTPPEQGLPHHGPVQAGGIRV
jgi:hypothetical protein